MSKRPTLDELLARAAALPPMTRAQRREQAIDFALGNLNASTRHRSTRAVVEREYDRIHGPPHLPTEHADLSSRDADRWWRASCRVFDAMVALGFTRDRAMHLAMGEP